MSTRTCLMVALATVLLAAGQLAASARSMILDVQQPPLAWADSDISEYLQTELRRNDELRVSAVSDIGTVLPSFPVSRADIDSLMNWGLEASCRYLLVVTIETEDLVRRKTFNLPLIFHRYETIGVISGEYRLLDVQKGRLLASEPIEVKHKGPRQFQGSTEDDRNDPGLHIPAPDKSRFFRKLEKKFAERLVKDISKHLRGR